MWCFISSTTEKRGERQEREDITETATRDFSAASYTQMHAHVAQIRHLPRL